MGVFQGLIHVEEDEQQQQQQQQVRKLVVHYGDMNTAEAWLRQAQHLTSLVAAEAASVKAFLGRWKAIENRLLQLPPLLTEMSHLHCLSDNKVCKELLQVRNGHGNTFLLILREAEFGARSWLRFRPLRCSTYNVCKLEVLQTVTTVTGSGCPVLLSEGTG